MGGGRRTTHLLRHYRPHRKLSAPPSSSHSPGSAGLGWEATRSLPRAPKFPFFGSVRTKNTPQPPRLCSPNPRFVLFNPLRLFPDVITLRRYSPHTNAVSYPSGIMTHFFLFGSRRALPVLGQKRELRAQTRQRCGSAPQPERRRGADALFVLTRLQSRHGNAASPAGPRKAGKGQTNQILSPELMQRAGEGWDGGRKGGRAPWQSSSPQPRDGSASRHRWLRAQRGTFAGTGPERALSWPERFDAIPLIGVIPQRGIRATCRSFPGCRSQASPHLPAHFVPTLNSLGAAYLHAKKRKKKKILFFSPPPAATMHHCAF